MSPRRDTSARHRGTAAGGFTPGSRARTPALPFQLVAAGAIIALLVGCVADAPSPSGTIPPATSTGASSSTEGPAETGAPYRDPWIDEPGPVTVTVTSDGAHTLAASLDAPWSVTRFRAGATLVSERDSGRILEVLPDGTTREVVTVPGVAHGGEGGLLGLAIAEGDSLRASSGEAVAWLFAMFTAGDGNRIVRYDVLTSNAHEVAVGDATEVLTGIPSASNHNGGRLAIGPDGLLYATAGDAGNPDLAQDPSSLAGKILRLELDGSVPESNPFGNAVFSMGHRNPQGLAWDRDGTLWASEFGQDTWDELNVIEAGANYGWPIVEGTGEDPAFRNPILQWSTSDASPSGLAWVGDTLFMASLRGERLWRIDVSGAEAVAEALFVGEFGRIRDVIPGPPDCLWIVTNNTDGRGAPSADDDRLVQLPVTRL